MVSYFKGRNNVMTTLVLMLGFSLLHKTPEVDGRKNPWVEFSKRDELSQMGGYGEEKLSTVLIYGSVLCQAYSPEKAQLSTENVVGAVVGVSCHSRRKTSKLSKWEQVNTDAYGDFVIDLPSHLHAISNLEKNCGVKVVSVPNSSLCRPFFTGNRAAGLKLSMEKDGIRTYAAQSINLIQKTSQWTKLRRNS